MMKMQYMLHKLLWYEDSAFPDTIFTFVIHMFIFVVARMIIGCLLMHFNLYCP